MTAQERSLSIIQDILVNHLPRVREGLEAGYVDENQILVIYDHAVRARILNEHAGEAPSVPERTEGSITGGVSIPLDVEYSSKSDYRTRIKPAASSPPVQEEGEWSTIRIEINPPTHDIQTPEQCLYANLEYRDAKAIVDAHNASLREKEESRFPYSINARRVINLAVIALRSEGHMTLAAELEEVARLSANPETKEVLQVLKSLRLAISDFKGHGMPGFTDRAQAYLVLERADECLSSHAPESADASSVSLPKSSLENPEP